jgi:hypothetical protein
MKRLVEYLPEAGFAFRSAFVLDQGGELVAAAWLGNVRAIITTKPSLLEIGVAACIPFEAEKFVDAWPFEVTIENEDGDRELLQFATADLKVVAAARRFNELAVAGQLREGMDL